MTEFFTRLVKEKPLRIIAGVVILLLILVAIFADFPAWIPTLADRSWPLPTGMRIAHALPGDGNRPGSPPATDFRQAFRTRGMPPGRVTQAGPAHTKMHA